MGDQCLWIEFANLKHDSLQTKFLPSHFALQDTGHDIFNLICAFSFVGDIGKSAEDYQFEASTLDANSLPDDYPSEPGI